MKATLLFVTLLADLGLQPAFADQRHHGDPRAQAALDRAGDRQIAGQQRSGASFRAGASFPRSPGRGDVGGRGVLRPNSTFRDGANDRRFVVDRHLHRGWDRRRDQVHGYRRYHWSGNSWVIYGLGYPYGYGYAGDGAYRAAHDIAQAPVEQQVQARLAKEGYYRGVIDGAVGPATRRAIASYERDHGLAANGRIDGSLLDALDLS